MTKRLLKTKRDHRQMRAVLTENTIAQTLSPAAGPISPGGVVGTPYTPLNFAINAPVGNARYSVSAGSLPAGLTLSSAGVLSGTPTAAVSNRAFSVTGTDDFGNSKTNAYTMTIAAS